jgi:hypothetical protein
MRVTMENEKQRLGLNEHQDSEELIERAQLKLQGAEADLRTRSSLIDIVGKRLSNLKKAMKKHVEVLNLFHEYAQKQTSDFFQSILKERNCRGDLIFNNGEEKGDKVRFEISFEKNVISDEASSAEGAPLTREGTHTGGMSGGERSYATLSLLLSLGSVVETPFRIMDEFDVFMDKKKKGKIKNGK